MSGTGQDRRQVSFAVSGANRMEIDDFVGHSVRDVRRGLRDALNIAQNSAVLVGGDNVAEDYVIQDGDQVEFIRASGEKGHIVS